MIDGTFEKFKQGNRYYGSIIEIMGYDRKY